MKVYVIYEYVSFCKDFVGVYSSQALAESAKCKLEYRAEELGFNADYRIVYVTMDAE